MPVKKKMVQNLVRQAAKDSEEKVHLLRLAGSKPGLWGGLEEDEVVGVLREVLKKETTGMMEAIAHTTNSCIVPNQLSLGGYVV